MRGRRGKGNGNGITVDVVGVGVDLVVWSVALLGIHRVVVIGVVWVNFLSADVVLRGIDVVVWVDFSSVDVTFVGVPVAVWIDFLGVDALWIDFLGVHVWWVDFQSGGPTVVVLLIVPSPARAGRIHRK